MLKNRILIMAGVSLAAFTSVAHAQTAPADAAAESNDDAGDVIVVTAQRRAESLQEVPISINAFSGKQIAEMHLNTPSDIAALAPGTFVTGSRGDSNPVFSIRGLSLNDTFSNNNPTVGVYFDEVIQPFTPMLSFQMFDLERVEVLKGPQGTLYGRNTTGGAINFISKKPSQDFDAYSTVSYGRFDRLEIEGAVGGPVSDTLAVRVAGKTVQQNGGWQTNALTGETIGDVSRIALRGQLLWTPTSDLSVLLKGGYMYENSDQQLREHVGYYAGAFGAGGYCAAALAGKRDESSCVDFLGYSDSTEERRTVENSSVYGHKSKARAQDVSLNVNYDLGGAALTSITSYNYYNRVAGDDSDGAALIELDSQFTDNIKAFTQELRLTSDNNSPFTWVGGLYYSYDRIAGDALQALDDHIFHTRANTGFVQKTDAYAAFGQASYALSDSLKLTAGLRFTRENKRFTYDAIDLDPYGTSTLPTTVSGIEDGIKQNNLSGKIGIDYKVTPDVLLYASASKGFKSGGFKAAIAFNADELKPFKGETVGFKAAIAFNADELKPFKGETVYAYEAGVKTTLLDGKLTLNAAGFYSDWQDFQAMVTEIRSGINVIVLSNAGDARVYGGEVEATLKATDRLQLRASGNLMSTKITDFNNAAGGADFTGNKLANAPAFTGTATARWETPIEGDNWGLSLLGDASYRSKVYYSLANRDPNSQKGYWLANARLAIHDKDDKWEAAVFGRNVFNKLYVSASYDNFGGIFPSQNFLGDPATYGVSFTVRY